LKRTAWGYLCIGWHYPPNPTPGGGLARFRFIRFAAVAPGMFPAKIGSAPRVCVKASCSGGLRDQDFSNKSPGGVCPRTQRELGGGPGGGGADRGSTEPGGTRARLRWTPRGLGGRITGWAALGGWQILPRWGTFARHTGGGKTALSWGGVFARGVFFGKRRGRTVRRIGGRPRGPFSRWAKPRVQR